MASAIIPDAAKLTPVVLLPAVASSNAALLRAEASLQAAGIIGQFAEGTDKVCIVKLDDWYEQGGAILAALKAR